MAEPEGSQPLTEQGRNYYNAHRIVGGVFAVWLFGGSKPWGEALKGKGADRQKKECDAAAAWPFWPGQSGHNLCAILRARSRKEDVFV